MPKTRSLKHSVAWLVLGAFMHLSLTMANETEPNSPTAQPSAPQQQNLLEKVLDNPPLEPTTAAEPAATPANSAKPAEQPVATSNDARQPEPAGANETEPDPEPETDADGMEPVTDETVATPELPPQTTLSDGFTPFFEPDVLLGGIDINDYDLVDFLRTVAREEKLNLVVDGTIDFQIYVQLDDPRTGINQLLNSLVHLYPISCERIGSFVYIRPDPKPKLVNDLRYDPHADTLAVELDGLSPSDFAEQLIDVTGKNVFLDDSVTALNGKQVRGTLAALPFAEALTELMRANQLGVKQKRNIFFIGRVPGVRVYEGLIDIWFEETPLSEIVHAVIAEGAFPITVSTALEGVKSVDLKGVKPEVLLPFLVSDTPYRYHQSGGVHFIGGEESVYLTDTKVLSFEKLHVGLIPKMLPETLLKQVEIKVVEETNTLVVTGHPTQVTTVIRVAKSLDQSVPQVLLEVYVVRIKDGNILNLGMNLTNGDNQLFPNLDVTVNGFRDAGNQYRIMRLPSDFKLKLQLWETENRLRVVQEPRLTALSGEEALLEFGTTLHYRTEAEEIVGDENPRIRTTQQIHAIDANITLQMTPYVIGKDTTKIDILTEFNTFEGAVADNVPPAVNVNRFKSSVNLRNGYTVVLGGLVTHSQNRKEKSVPGISKVPLLGALFRDRNWDNSLDQTLIYITPRIYVGAEAHDLQVEDLRVLDPRIRVTDKMTRQQKREQRRQKRAAKRAAKIERLRALAPPQPVVEEDANPDAGIAEATDSER